MKKLNLMVIVTVFTMILLCSCAQNNDVMASVNGCYLTSRIRIFDTQNTKSE